MPENATYRSLEALLAKKGGELVVDVVNNFDERKVNGSNEAPMQPPTISILDLHELTYF